MSLSTRVPPIALWVMISILDRYPRAVAIDQLDDPNRYHASRRSASVRAVVAGWRAESSPSAHPSCRTPLGMDARLRRVRATIGPGRA